jgi:hypothetical protein
MVACSDSDPAMTSRERNLSQEHNVRQKVAPISHPERGQPNDREDTLVYLWYCLINKKGVRMLV